MSLKALFEEYDRINAERLEAAARLAEINRRLSDKVAEIAKSPEVGGKKMVIRGGVPHTLVRRGDTWFFRVPKSGSVEVED